MASKIIFDQQIMAIMSLFDTITHAHLKDCINLDQQIIFIVEKDEMAKAIGKGGLHVKLLEKKLNKHIKIVEFDEDRCRFTSNLIYPAQIRQCRLEEKTITLEAEDSSSRGLIIGRNATSLRKTEEIVKRYFDIDEIRVK